MFQFLPMQASELLRDMTLGANMRVHLVRMIILSEPEVSYSLSNIQQMTRSEEELVRAGH